MVKTTYLRDLSRAITRGDYDESLDTVGRRVYKALKDRRLALSEEHRAQLKEGQHVKVIKGNFKPRYFAGSVGTITHFDGDMVWIKLDKPIERPTKTLGAVGIPALYVEVLDD